LVDFVHPSPVDSTKEDTMAHVVAEVVHPTFAEGLQSLVMRLPRFALEE
jgi:hypothetical protein